MGNNNAERNTTASERSEAERVEKLSISIVTMNNRDMNRDCLASIFERTQGISFKVFVLDNDSNDDTVRMIRQEFPRVELIESKERHWFTTNQNMLLRRIQSEYVLVLNNDTVFLDNSIKAMTVFLDTHPDAGAIACRILNADGSFQETSLRCDYDLLTIFSIKTGLAKLFPKSRIWGRPLMGYADREAIQEIDVYSGACVMIRKKVLDEVGLLDDNIHFGPDDYDYSYRIRQRGWKIYYVPSARVVHLNKKTRNTNKVFYLEEEVRGILYLYRKHYGRFRTFVLKLLMVYGALLKPFLWVCLFLRGKLTREELNDTLALQGKFMRMVIFYPLKKQAENPDT
jgi:GT2 family glycosyltransferase